MTPKLAFVQLSIAVPGAQLPFAAPDLDGNKATVDILGMVEDDAKRPAARFRDTVRIDARDPRLRRKIVQYETGVELKPGRYRVKVVTRENATGTFGSYETTISVPAPSPGSLDVSSIVVSTQMQPHAPKDRRNPLVVNGTAIVPNVTHVVSRAQHLQFYYEVYDAGTTWGPAPSLSVATTVTFFKGMTPVLETPAIEAHAANDAARGAVAFRFDVDPQDLEPGLYTCQVNIIDQLRGAFAFPRFELYVRP